MRFSKKRKLPAEIRVVHIRIAKEVREKLERMAGADSLAVTVETLIEREYRRREKRLMQPVQEKPC